MGHNLEYNERTGTTSFVSAKNLKAWHGLGQILPDDLLTAEQCIKHANLDFTVALEEVYTITGNGATAIPDKFCTYRTDNNTPLGIVGNRYEIVQNIEGFNFFDTIIGEASAIYETAGVLGKGEHVFLTAKMPDTIRIAGTDDITEIYVVLKMSHDGSGAIKAMITPIRVVCQNTLNAAIKAAKNSVNIRHTKNASNKLSEAHKLLGVSHKYIDQVNEMFNALAQKKVDLHKWDGLVKSLFPSSKDEDSTRIKNIREAVNNFYFTGIGQKGIIGTGWGAYNAITGYLNHSKSYHNETSKFESIFEGNSAKIQQTAFELLMNN